MTRAEWERLREALTALDDRAQEDIRRRVREEEARVEGKTVCPILDLESGHCRTYPARPIACRTYGYYVERDGGLHCDLVTRFAEEHPVVWGNGEAIAQDMRALGETATLVVWMGAGWGAGSSSDGGT
jgi:Fe-S-cluster containining protein